MPQVNVLPLDISQPSENTGVKYGSNNKSFNREMNFSAFVVKQMRPHQGGNDRLNAKNKSGNTLQNHNANSTKRATGFEAAQRKSSSIAKNDEQQNVQQNDQQNDQQKPVEQENSVLETDDKNSLSSNKENNQVSHQDSDQASNQAQKNNRNDLNSDIETETALQANEVNGDDTATTQDILALEQSNNFISLLASAESILKEADLQTPQHKIIENPSHETKNTEGLAGVEEATKHTVKGVINSSQQIVLDPKNLGGDKITPIGEDAQTFVVDENIEEAVNTNSRFSAKASIDLVQSGEVKNTEKMMQLHESKPSADLSASLEKTQSSLLNNKVIGTAQVEGHVVKAERENNDGLLAQEVNGSENHDKPTTELNYFTTNPKPNSSEDKKVEEYKAPEKQLQGANTQNQMNAMVLDNQTAGVISPVNEAAQQNTNQNTQQNVQQSAQQSITHQNAQQSQQMANQAFKEGSGQGSNQENLANLSQQHTQEAPQLSKEVSENDEMLAKKLSFDVGNHTPSHVANEKAPTASQSTLPNMNNQFMDNPAAQETHKALQIEQATAQVHHDAANQIKQNNLVLNETISIFRKDFADAVKEKVMVIISQKLQRFDIKLDPPELGNVHVKVNMQNEQAVVNFTVQNQQAKEAFEQNMDKLRSMLAEKGVDVGDANVEQQAQQSNKDKGNQDLNTKGGNNYSPRADENNFETQENLTLVGDLANYSSSKLDYYA